MATIFINGESIEAEEGKTILEVALENGIYIPNLCYHPNVSPAPGKQGISAVYRGEGKIEGEEGEYDGCGLCLVSADGEIVKACIYKVRDGLKVETESDEVKAQRQRDLSKILATHPHVCITCSYREGCDRIQCTFGYPVEERCCDLFPKCELRYVSEYIGVPEDTPKYVFADLPVVEEKMYRWNWNYCINCTRCVRGCEEVREAKALAFTIADGTVVGRTGPSDKESGCKYCGVCVEICPTGVVRDFKVKARNKWRDSIIQKQLPQLKELTPLTAEEVEKVPSKPGVFRIYDEQMELVYIKGTPNLKEELGNDLDKGEYFDYEEYEMYTMRESELIQEYLQKHGRMPKYNDELEDLF